MKMLPDDFSAMKAAVLSVVERYPLAARDYSERGFSAERYRWDMLHASGFPTGPLYRYLDDSHIDTALRAIMSDAAQASR